MSLQEEFSQKFSGLRHAYSIFTPTQEIREDGKAKGKNVTISKTLTKEELVEFMNKLYIENVWCFGKNKEFDFFRHTRRATLEGLF